MVELGDFYAGERRRLLLEIDVPAMSGLGLAQVCELELRYVELPDLSTELITVLIHVNVVPGDEAAGRIPNPTVRSERAFQDAQRSKREAAEALRDGDVSGAARVYRDAAGAVDASLPQASEPMAAELKAEADLLRDHGQRAMLDDPRRTAKLTRSDQHRKSRQRGRR
jgi:Ca-activated chloride channel family protein